MNNFILETSWEVCNKMGGIYTVLSSRARVMMQEHNGQVVFVGPLLGEAGTLPRDFDPTIPEILRPWVETVQVSFPLRTAVGQWSIPGTPPVILVDFSPLWEEKGDIYFRMWEQYGVQSDKGYGDYDESCLFSVAAARVMHSVLECLQPEARPVAIFNEWQTAMGLLWSKLYQPTLSTLFITHATTVGRSIAGNGKQLYAWMPHYNGDQMASELGVEAKHGIEKRAAHVSDIFATVSKLTASECTQLIERTPIVLPNGFEGDFVPRGRAFDKARKTARERLADIASALTGLKITDKDFFVSLGGRYEYRNKGIDIFVEALAELRRTYKGKRRITAFLLVPAWVAEPRADLQYLLEHPDEPRKGLDHPTLTHWLHNMDEDSAQSHYRHLGLDTVDPLVNITSVPVYLNGHDGIVGLSYYDLLIGMDQTIYPSYYEPWGYTPLESVAFGVPTVTTCYAGFGLWADEQLLGTPAYQDGIPVAMLERTDFNGQEVVEAVAEQTARQATGKLGTARALRQEAMRLAELAEWEHFYRHYLDAYASL